MVGCAVEMCGNEVSCLLVSFFGSPGKGAEVVCGGSLVQLYRSFPAPRSVACSGLNLLCGRGMAPLPLLFLLLLLLPPLPLPLLVLVLSVLEEEDAEEEEEEEGGWCCSASTNSSREARKGSFVMHSCMGEHNTYIYTHTHMR